MTTQPENAGIRPLALVNVTSQDALLSDLKDHLARGEGFSIATLNLDHTVKLDRDPAFRDAYALHSHVTADGRPIVWLSRLAGQDISLVTGSDLVAPLVALCAQTGTPVALVGSTDAVLQGAAAVLTDAHPGLSIAARIAPKMGFDPLSPDADTLIAQIKASGAGVCLIALGAPKQEILATRLTAALPTVGAVSVGAGLDFLVGAQVRAPRIFRALAAEWLWRLLRDPRQMAGRYGACVLALPRLTRHALHLRRMTVSGRLVR